MKKLLKLFGFGKRRELVANYRSRGAVVIDVRTKAEFSGGHIPGSINIPLDGVKRKVSGIKKLKKPVILVCASGNRSGSATYILRAEGIDCINGGGWRSLL